MLALSVDPKDAITQLDALVASARLPAREADRCARLADTLRRPARVCLLGPAKGDIADIVRALLDPCDLPDAAFPPAMELRHGAELMFTATMEDGSTTARKGWPCADITALKPVFLQIELPSDRLRAVSFLVLALEADPNMHRPALSWAARRSEIAIWATPSFTIADARIWGRAPERLTHHAYLLETRPDADAPRHIATSNFTDSFKLNGPGADIAPILNRLTADIEDARNADIDMAQLVLHRLGHLASVARSAGEEAAGPDTQATPDQRAALLPILSEPLLYLTRRARALADHLAWAEDEDDWAVDVLTHCAETTEGLRDRAADWPEEVASVGALRDLVDEVCDMTTLLQIEAGSEQAEDAAALLSQLRVGLEVAMGMGRTT